MHKDILKVVIIGDGGCGKAGILLLLTCTFLYQCNKEIDSNNNKRLVYEIR